MSFDLQPRLKGELIELRPIASKDWDDLFAVASDPLIWEQHPESDRYKEEVFKIFFKGALVSGRAFIVVDTKTQRISDRRDSMGTIQRKQKLKLDGRF